VQNVRESKRKCVLLKNIRCDVMQFGKKFAEFLKECFGSVFFPVDTSKAFFRNVGKFL